jgi:small subunit ribosomal protein S20
MANTKSAKKAARQSMRRAVVNQSRRTRARSAVRKVEEAISAGDRAAALAAMAEAEPAMIRAAQKGIMHRNAAQRKVSRLSHQIAKLGKK